MEAIAGKIASGAQDALAGVGKRIPRPIAIGDYLLARLKELGCNMVFGLPGDFNMEFLDQIEDFDGVEWGYNANELNAGYAADGYARIKGIGALCTTFGVGELSAVNAIAGSMSEMVPVVHIVGTPSTVSQKNGAILHHTLGNGDFGVFTRMYEPITVAQASIVPENAASEIDRVLRECYIKRRPVYIALPTDVSARKIVVDMTPLDLSVPKNREDIENECVKHILTALGRAERPAILIDGCASRFHVEKEVRAFVEKSGFPVYAAPMGKGIVSEFHAQFRGSYVGAMTPSPTREELESSDVVVMVGAIKSDFNTGGFTFSITNDKLIELHSDHAKVFHATYQSIGFKGILQKLTDKLTHRPWTLPPAVHSGTKGYSGDDNTEIRHEYFWDALGKHLGAEAHAVVVETGTSSFGTSTQRLADGSKYISQVLWGSIGYATAAALGTALAGRELDKPLRTVLVTGDGSFQLTAQEISTFLRHKVTPVIIILNNNGYTIERFIHGPERAYNTTTMWKYKNTLDYFSADEYASTYPKFGLQARIERKQEVEAALAQVFSEKDAIHVLEVVMPKMDAPMGLVKTGEATSKENKYNGDS
ncbi:Pyruvate decarboxylase 1 [Thoreauomyces humboldtii]|nr:Pyruvate decarboxylase 1 [Thoreauomyces humboldtii]